MIKSNRKPFTCTCRGVGCHAPTLDSSRFCLHVAGFRLHFFQRDLYFNITSLRTSLNVFPFVPFADICRKYMPLASC